LNGHRNQGGQEAGIDVAVTRFIGAYSDLAHIIEFTSYI